MKEKKIKELHFELLHLLKSLDNICSINDINYSLYAGSLLGAVRHQGFIPWDDDADIVMERKEYEVFFKSIPNDFEIIRHLWQLRFKQKNKKLFIDIFVLDHTSRKKVMQKIHILKLKFLQGVLKETLSMKKGNLLIKGLSLITYLIGLPFSYNYKFKLYKSVSTKYNATKTSFLLTSNDQFKYLHHVYPYSIVKSYSKIPFENTELKAMVGYNLYLKEFYGNYMQKPPIHLQKPEHGHLNLLEQ
jgi:lipopolysaccharide cholinephosphotransferase